MEAERHCPYLPTVDARLEHFEERNGFLRALVGLAHFVLRAEAMLKAAAELPARPDSREAHGEEAYVLLGALSLSAAVRGEMDAMLTEGARHAPGTPREEPTRVGNLLR